MPRNVLVAQSGGPTPVINNSLRGVIEACRDYPGTFGTIYGGWHGVEGVLQEQLIDLSCQDPREVAYLETTPGAGVIGTCRYKLKDEHSPDFDRFLDVIRAHQIGYFFYIGGNDSMDTASKLSRLARDKGVDLLVVGIPKTIDNDLGDAEFTLIDHTPGYGSVARFWACHFMMAEAENAGSYPADPVLVIQVMGRRTGFIPAAARLADPARRTPLQIYMPESGLNLESLTERVAASVHTHGRCVVALSEGFDSGAVGGVRDAFGHIEYGASDLTAQQAVVSHLNRKGLRARGSARGEVPGTMQRTDILYASPVDLAEAYAVARHAVAIAAAGDSGKMATLLRDPGPDYRIRYDCVPLDRMANRERSLPAHWLAPGGVDVTDEFIRYARPLVGDEWVRVPLADGLPRFACFVPRLAPRLCAPYVPEGFHRS